MAPENPDEVRQRIDSLYDRAESETGNYNATRAMSLASRGRGVPLAKRRGGRPDPALDAVARPWFDAARAKLGPSAPAVLPKDRQPDRFSAPARPRDRSGGALPGGDRGALEPGLPELAPGSARPAAGRVMPELTSGSAADLTGRPRAALEARAPGLPGFAAPLPELPGRSGRAIAELPVGGMPELPGGSAPRLDGPDTTASLGLGLPAPTGLVAAAPSARSTAGFAVPGAADALGLGLPGPAGLGPAETSVLPVAALPAAQGAVPRQPRALPASPAVSGRPSLADSKARNRRKLAIAQELLSRHTASLATPLTTAPAQGAWGTVAEQTPQPAAGHAVHPSTEQWGQPGLQQPGQLDPRQPDLGLPDPLSSGQWQQPQWTAPGVPTAPSPATPLTTAAPMTDTGSFAPLVTNPLTNPLTDPLTGPLTDTGSFAYIAAAPMTDTGSIAPVTHTGSFPPVTTDPPAGSAAFPPAPTAPRSTRSTRVAKAIDFARAQTGKPCVWGATGPDSYDCSSLTQAAWRAAGVTLPRAAHQQALAGTPVTLAGLEPGDLVLFFDDDRHVGLHIGDGMMIHAPGPGSYIREESIYGAGESAIHRVIRPA
ncbi:C40 family peptidase [Streptomyces griseochromogenes]|uniref:C40 family peptidase n=1 Tax=Streptomyces griseochromogenes TaxID=68214 RepID=UPI00379C5BC2